MVKVVIKVSGSWRVVHCKQGLDIVASDDEEYLRKSVSTSAGCERVTVASVTTDYALSLSPSPSPIQEMSSLSGHTSSLPVADSRKKQSKRDEVSLFFLTRFFCPLR